MIHPKKRTAIIIRGPQGCGKTTLANAIAGTFGTFTVTTMDELTKTFTNGIFEGSPDTVIVDEFQPTQNNLLKVVAWLTESEVVVHQMYKDSVAIPTPNFIFCTGDVEPLKVAASARRFVVIDL